MKRSLKKLWKKALRGCHYNRYGRLVLDGDDRLSKSLKSKYRWRTDSDGEGYVEYGFVGPEMMVYDYDPDVETLEEVYASLSEEEIDQWFEENMEIDIWSEYDCTGKPFTRSIRWHRNPCGLVSYVHHVEYDV